ncbi:MAG: hypothetical protein E7504_01675 [Ruminococcus sp.]|nr:hypothetical protein [Ruminococcus sp.]
MKKVVSALTAAAMCASMAASVVSVFAYSSKDIGFYLKVNSEGKYTVSDDGKTITFASAADAAGAKFTVGQYISADPSKAAVQQTGGMVQGSDPAIHLPLEGANLDDTVASYDQEITYKAGDTEFSTNAFVNCFGWVTKRGKYKGGCGNISYNHSSKYPDSFKYTDDEERFNWIWMYSFDASVYDNFETTANFLGTKSDDFPLTQFEVELDSSIKEGKYTIDFVEKYTNEYGEAEATFVNDGSNIVIPDTLESLTIVVGDAGSTEPDTTEPQPTEPQPTEPQPTEPDATEPDQPSDGGFKWYITEEVKPEDDGYAEISVFVADDPGTGAYTFQMLINGKEFSEYGIEIEEIAKGTAYSMMDTFVPNVKIGYVGASSTTTTDPQFAKANTPVATFGIVVPEDMPEGKYELSFAKSEFKVGDANGKELSPELVSGYLIVGDAGSTEPDTTEPKPTEPDTTEPKPTEPDTTEPKPTEPDTTEPGDNDYLYGDVNKNGKVELVDIVLLNRHLTGYEDQKLDDYQTEVADCYDNGKLEGTDSIEILKYLIGNVTSLPTAAK